MRRSLTIIVEFGRCGFGVSRGDMPRVRLGFVCLAWWRGSLLEKLQGYERSLTMAGRVLSEKAP